MIDRAPHSRVLVIEDDEGIARGIARALRDHEVAVASTAQHGCELAQQLRPDLVILDFYLPDGTGKDVIERLREGGIRAPVLLMSGAIDTEQLADWVAYAADDFVAKPVSSEQLRRKAERLLQAYSVVVRADRQHAELEEMRASSEREADAARRLLDKMLQRGHFDPSRVRIESLSVGRFGGDVVFGQELPGGTYRWLVGDATGHTLASALVTIPISMLFYAPESHSAGLDVLISKIDQNLGAMLPVTMFFAAATLELDRARGTLSIHNAAFPDVLIRRSNGEIDAVSSSAPPLGAMRSPQLEPVIESLAVAPGDRIYTFSDGLLDVRDRDGSLFGIDRVKAILRAAPVADGFAHLGEAWRAHARTAALDDDISIVEVIV